MPCLRPCFYPRLVATQGRRPLPNEKVEATAHGKAKTPKPQSTDNTEAEAAAKGSKHTTPPVEDAVATGANVDEEGARPQPPGMRARGEHAGGSFHCRLLPMMPTDRTTPCSPEN